MFKHKRNHIFPRVLQAGALCLLALAGLWSIQPAAAGPISAPDAQVPIYTPTPGPDGRIIYIVKANDTLLSISLLTGVSVDELKGLNNMTTDMIVEGQQLLLGMGGPEEMTPTPGPTPTPTPVLPTATPRTGTANLCVLLFNDTNGDAMPQDGETQIPDGAISVGNRLGTVSKTATSLSGEDPYCFEGLPEGEYEVSVAAPTGYNPTTANSFGLTLKSGDQAYLDFGAQPNSQTENKDSLGPTGNDSGNRSPLLGIIGGLFLAAGVVLALFAGRLLKKG